MSLFISYARKTLIVVLMVAIATIAVPYDDALAGLGPSPTAEYRETTGQRALQQQRIAAVQGTITAAETGATALATGNLFVKENLLDGIAFKETHRVFVAPQHDGKSSEKIILGAQWLIKPPCFVNSTTGR